MEVVVGFELDDGEAAVGGDAEEIEEASVIGAGDGGDLGIDVLSVEVRDGCGFLWRAVGKSKSFAALRVTIFRG